MIQSLKNITDKVCEKSMIRFANTILQFYLSKNNPQNYTHGCWEVQHQLQLRGIHWEINYDSSKVLLHTDRIELWCWSGWSKLSKTPDYASTTLTYATLHLFA